MSDKGNSPEKAASGNWFGRLETWVKLAGGVVVLVVALLGADRCLRPAATVKFELCEQEVLGVHVINKGGSTAAISPMKFEISANGTTMRRDMEAVVYVDEDGKEMAPVDPNRIVSLAKDKARGFHFPTEGVYFQPEDTACEIRVTVPIRWKDKPRDYFGTCKCQF